MELKKGKIYKICHNDITIGKTYNEGFDDAFTVETNSIIFSPIKDMAINTNVRKSRIECQFLITFDNIPIVNGIENDVSTAFFPNTCKFMELNKSDFDRIVMSFKGKNRFNELSMVLRPTEYVYNRKLDTIIKKV